MNYDIRLRLFQRGAVRGVAYTSPSSVYIQDFIEQNPASGGTSGMFDFDGTTEASVRVFDAQGQLLGDDISTAATAIYDDGLNEKQHFEIFDASTAQPTWFEDIQQGRALRLGGNHVLTHNQYRGVNGASARTTAAWVRQSGSNAVLVGWGSNGAGRGWRLRAGSVLSLEYGGGRATGSTPIDDSQWHHVAAVLPAGATTAGEIQLYVDGVLEQVTVGNPATALNTSGNRKLRIGNGNNNQPTYEGDLDDVRVYSRGLSAAEIASLVAGEVVASANLEGHWQFSETSGAVATDSSGNNRDLAASNISPELSGRLARIEDVNGYELTLNYVHDVDATIDTNSRKWQLVSVSDAHQRTITYQYLDTQVGGQWVISQIGLPNGSEVTYSYDGLHLTGVNHPDGTTSSFTTEIESNLVKYTIRDSGASGTSRNKQAYFTTGAVATGGGSGGDPTELFNQAAMQIRLLANPQGETTYANTNAVGAQGGRLVYEGGGKSSVEGISSRRFFTTLNRDADGNITDFELENTYSRMGVGPSTLEQRYNRVPEQIRDEQNVLYQMEYDDVGNVTRQQWIDGTFITFERDIAAQSGVQLQRVTRQRDRLGRVEKFTYDARGNILTHEEGILEVNGVDVPQSEFARTVYEYFPDGHPNQHLLKTVKDPLFDDAAPDLHRTDYEYDARQFMVKKIESADVAGGLRPETTYVYDAAGRLQSSTDPLGRTTEFQYDSRDRQILTTYFDGSTEENVYGTAMQSNLMIARKDRNGNFTQYRFDDYGRAVTTIVGIDNRSDALDPAFTPDPSFHRITTCEFVDGTSLKSATVTNGERTEYVYDYRHRLIESTTFPRDGQSLTSRTAYRNNLRFSQTDPYGRSTFYGYRDSDRALVRTATGTHTGFRPNNNNRVMELTRPAADSTNDRFLIRDAILDVARQTIAVIDARGIVDTTTYDSRGRAVLTVESATTLPPYNAATFDPTDDSQLDALAAKTQTIYDANSNVVEVHHPRFFDSGDTDGFERCSTASTYTGRNLLSTQTAAHGADDFQPGSPTNVRVTMSYDYYPDRRLRSMTDYRGNTSQSLWHQCCGRSQGSIDQAGHGTLSNTDFYGNVTHTAFVEDLSGDVSTNANGLDVVASAHNPADDRTINETTTRYDSRHRVIARTQWLEPRGEVDPNNVPIAGGGQSGDPAAINGDGSFLGLTSRIFYDENLTDGSGLDAGIAVAKLDGSGNLTLNLTPLLTELAADGVAIGAGGDFMATVSLNPADEISASISDANGRSVAQGRFAADGTLVTWNSTLHDTLVNVRGFGSALETASIDALDQINRSRTDGAGRSLQSVDAEGNIATMRYDGNSNAVQVRDANGTGQDCVFDIRDRRTTCTDTQGDVTATQYNVASQVIQTTDAKGPCRTKVKLFAY